MPMIMVFMLTNCITIHLMQHELQTEHGTKLFRPTILTPAIRLPIQSGGINISAVLFIKSTIYQSAEPANSQTTGLERHTKKMKTTLKQIITMKRIFMPM